MNLPLDLNRPLCIFDLEATSTDPDEARIFQFGCVKLYPDERSETCSSLFDPMKPIPEDIEELTGISNDDVVGKPVFTDKIDVITGIIHGADLAGHNAKEYDIPLLKSAFNRSGVAFPPPKDRVVLDTLELQKELSSLSLEALYRLYSGSELEEGHTAAADAKAALEVLRGQSEVFDLSELSPANVENGKLSTYLDPNGKFEKVGKDIVFRFGKHYGKTLEEVQNSDYEYIEWLLSPSVYDDLGQHLVPYLDR